MTPFPAERDALFRDFAKAFFKNDLDALYRVVVPEFRWDYYDGVSQTKSLVEKEAIGAHLAEQKKFFSAQHYHDVVYHHLPDVSFMTFRVSETIRATGLRRDQSGVELYTFRDGKIATKDVYRKPSA